jgi:hypothetical protein
MSCSAGPMMGGRKKRGGDEEEPSNVKNVKTPGESYPGQNDPNVNPPSTVSNIKPMVPEGAGRRRRTMRRLRGPGIGKLRTGALHGYMPTKSKTARRTILRKVVRRSSPLTTFRRLQALSTYTKRTAPSKSRTAKADRNWVKKTFMKK